MKNQNASLLLFSFVLTLVTWLYVGSLFDPAKSQEFNVPLVIESRSGYVAVYPPESWTIVVTGSSTSMSRLRPQDLRAVANVTNIDGGTINAPITVTGPKDLDLAYAPKVARVRVTLEKEDRKPFTVEFRQPGPEGLTAGTLPPKVLVRGPESIVAQVARATVAYDLSKDHSAQEAKWKVELLDKEGKQVGNLTVEPDMVEIDTTQLSLAPRSLVVSPALFGQPAKGFKYAGATVKPAVVKAKVPPTLAATLASLSTEPVHIENASADVTVNVKVITPDGVQVIGSAEVEVTVKIVADPSAAASSAPPPVKKT